MNNDLTSEIEKATLLLDTALAANNSGLAKGLLDSLRGLKLAQARLDCLNSRYLHRAAVDRMVGEVLGVVNSELNTLPENVRIELVDRILARLQSPAQAVNTAAEARALLMLRVE